MSIPIEAENKEIAEGSDSYENCIFCNENTIYWIVNINRPCCALCSVANEVSDVPEAPFNY